MKSDVLEKIITRSKKRKTGFYALNGIKYAVKDGQLMFICDYGQMYQFSYGFLVNLGRIEHYKAKEKFKELMK